MTTRRYPELGGSRHWWQVRRGRQRREDDYERMLDDLRARLEAMRQERDDAERMAASEGNRAQIAESELADMHRELALAASRQQSEPAVPAPSSAAISQPDNPAGQPPAVATRILFIADRLSDFMAAGPPADPQRASVMVGWVNGMIPELLGDCGVRAFQDDGPLDTGRHEVVGVRPAPVPDLVGHIAETIRSGYEWHGDLLRAQRVVTYSADDR